MIISELYRYPLKSGQAEALPSAEVLATGFPDDRRWVLVDAGGRFLTQREYPELALVQTLIGDKLKFEWQGQSLTVERGYSGNITRPITVWRDTQEAWDLGDPAAEFFSGILGKDVRLCEAHPGDERLADVKYTGEQTVPYLFADSFPYLIISQESLDLLNDKLVSKGESKVSMDRFRPNIVIQGWEAHAEDQIQTITIGGKVQLRLSKPCARCNVTTIDQVTGAVGREPLPTLAQYRKLGTSKILFGMNAFVQHGAGQTIRVGDAVTSEA